MTLADFVQFAAQEVGCESHTGTLLYGWSNLLCVTDRPLELVVLGRQKIVMRSKSEHIRQVVPELCS